MKILKQTDTSLHLRFNQISILIIYLLICVGFLGTAIHSLNNTTRMELACQPMPTGKTCQLTNWRWFEQVADRRSIQLNSTHLEQRLGSRSWSLPYNVLILDTDQGPIQFEVNTDQTVDLAHDQVSQFLAKSDSTQLRLNGKSSLRKLLLPTSFFAIFGFVTGLRVLKTPFLIEWKFEKSRSESQSPHRQAIGEAKVYSHCLLGQKETAFPLEEIVSLNSYSYKSNYIQINRRNQKPMNLYDGGLPKKEYQKVIITIYDFLGIAPP